MGKCPEHAVTIWQDIVHMAVLAHQEALNISISVSTDGGVDVGTWDVGIVTPGGSTKLGVATAYMCLENLRFTQTC